MIDLTTATRSQLVDALQAWRDHGVAHRANVEANDAYRMRHGVPPHERPALLKAAEAARLRLDQVRANLRKMGEQP